MTREFKTPDYEATLNSTITLRKALPPNHLASCVVDVITQLDLRPIYARYAPGGGVALAPEILLGLLFYGYATGREPHHHSWHRWFAAQPTPPPADASALLKMAYKLQTDIGQAIYGLRKQTVEPVIR